jgi:MFS family permease
MSVYSFMQFVFAPFWGRISDQRGRRPILLFCLFGESISYVLFVLSRSLEMLFVARALAGFFGASLSTASAAVSDVTASHERSKGMALIGAAFGLGFVFGPALGGGVAWWGQKLQPDDPQYGMRFAAAFVALICLATFVFAFFKLKETRKAGQVEPRRESRFERLGRFLKRPVTGPLIGSFFLNSFAMSTMEATLILFVGDRFGWGLKEVSFGFAFVGLLSAFSQGFLVRRLLPRFGERRILRVGLVLLALSYFSIVVSSRIWILAVAMVLLSFGNSFCSPSLLGSISLLCGKDEQGEALGTTQGTASLGRILGPAFGGFLYGQVHLVSPFVASGVLALSGLFIVLSLGDRVPNSALLRKESV